MDGGGGIVGVDGMTVDGMIEVGVVGGGVDGTTDVGEGEVGDGVGLGLGERVDTGGGGTAASCARATFKVRNVALTSSRASAGTFS